MAISIENQILRETGFQNESELQGYLERCPYLLVSESEPSVHSVQREVRLPSAGILDLLLVDETGCPIAVEVKLSSNGQSRREVVAQAFDYVSDLSQLTVDELDNLVDGALEETLFSINANNSLWKSCGVNLRAGIIKVIIAVDKVNEDLRRIVQYINEHSDLDVRLVSISKYNEGKILVPNISVTGNGGLTNSTTSRPRQHEDINTQFEGILETYDGSTDYELRTRGRSKSYRQVRYDSWPSPVHYEFVFYKRASEITTELHIENDNYKYLGNTLRSFVGKSVGGKKVEWDEKWSSGRGRIRVRFSSDASPEAIANGMRELINLTSNEVTIQLKANKAN